MHYDHGMTTWRPDLISLRLFVAVCEETSIAQAAERESIAPSAVSKRIAEIEDLIRVPLLVRGNRGVRPTAAGTAFLHHARRIIASTEQLQAEMVEYAGGARGHVRVLANISSLVQFLPRDISTFLTSHQQVRVDLQERVTSEVLDGIADGSADIGICLDTTASHGLECMPYESDRLIVLVHPDHPLARREAVRFEETTEYDFVGLQPNTGTSIFLSGLAARVGRSLNYRLHVSTFEAICHIVAENLAIAIVADGAVRLMQNALGLRAVPLDEPWATREIIMAMRSYETLSAPARSLVDHLRLSGSARRLD